MAMILFMILAIMLVVMAVFALLIIGIGGGIFTIIFADVIVCILLIAWIIRKLAKRKKK